ncbi:MAG: hypothetical protein QM699_14065 [Amaricoccus sp.]|uniref:hypothetical protein n=1 Tax=Amaricoccus sp. TaxID=1872485 RepID=UPI0039E2B4C7
MIELLIAACLSTGPCQDFRPLRDAREVSLLTCMTAGQPQVASWQQAHPLWQVRRWQCGIPDPTTARL